MSVSGIMDPFVSLVLGFLFVTLLTILYFQWYKPQQEIARFIDKIPGYKAYPLVGTSWIFFGVPREKIFDVLQEGYRRFPHIHRTWFGSKPEVRIAKAEYVEKILSSSKHIEKSFIYNFSKPWLGDGLLHTRGKYSSCV